MVHTRSAASFAEDYPLLHALTSRDDALVAQLLHDQPSLATACGPGGFSPLHACALMDSPQHVAALVAAGALLEARLALGSGDAALYSLLEAGLLSSSSVAASGPWLWRNMRSGQTPLALSASLGHMRAVQALVDGTTDVLDALDVGLDNRAADLLVPILVQHYDEGRLAITTSTQLGKLVYVAGRQDQLDFCLLVLQRAAQQQLALSRDYTIRMLVLAVSSGHTHLVGHLLATYSPSSDFLQRLAGEAAVVGHAGVLEVLLAAGASVDVELMDAVIVGLQPECLRMLLRRGPLPVGTSTLCASKDDIGSLGDYTCPILNTLRKSAQGNRPLQGLRILEALLAAGHRPTVYKNVALGLGSAPVADYDPLKERPGYFALHSTNKYLWLALQPEGWSPATHARHPPALKAAFRAVLLAAAAQRRGQRRGQSRSGGGQVAPSVGQQGKLAKAEGSSAGPHLLASLPQELLLHILHLAARPLSAWVTQ